ncbi:hypothetical protein Tco_0252406 [Tanacetum coccineum]
MVKIHTDKNVADLLTKAFDVSGMKWISEKRTKNEAKTDKTEHGMEKRGKAKVKSKPMSKKVKAKTINREVQLHALVDGKKIIITESTVRRDLQLEDAEGVDCLPNSTIFEQLALMGSKTTTWNEFSSNMAFAIICLATNQKFNFSKYIFESMVRNLDNLSGKFLMYPRRVGKGFSGRVTPLLSTMVVQNQSKLGEGLANPTDPHHTPTIIQSSTQPQKTQKPRKPKRKDTQVPQPSDPSENVADEAVHKELGDSLVRAATTASSLEAEQDSGNITKTRSKATPNESSSLGTTSGGGPRCQETMGDTIAQTRFENVSKHSNDSLLARGNTLRSDEDRLKLNELMELCTTLQNRVLDLEKTKTTQQNEIDSLKRRVKKLEKKRSSRTHKLKRLYKVGLTARVESSGDEEDLGEDASKQGRRINAIDADEDITLVNVQDDADNEMFDVNVLNGEEVFVAGQNENVVEEVVDVVQVSTAATTVTITTEEITLAQTLKALKTLKPKDKGKGIMIEEPMKPMKKKVQIMLDEEVASKLQAEFDEEERLARKKAGKEKEANIALIEEWDDIQEKIDADYHLAKRMQVQEQEELSNAEKATLFQQLLEKRKKHFAAKRLNDLKSKGFDSIQEMFDRAFKRQKVDDDKETIELKQCMEIILDEEEVTIDAIPLAVKSPRIVDWKIYKEGKKSYYQIIKANVKSQMYKIFSQMLKSFDREDLEDLYKLVKARYGSTRRVESMDYLLWNDMKIMFELHVEDASMQIYRLVEKKYPLAPPTLSMMLEKKLQINYESEMAYQLYKLIIKQLKK